MRCRRHITCVNSNIDQAHSDACDDDDDGDDAGAADVALGCEVVHHEERVDYVEVLGVAAGPASASIISVRVTPGQSPHQASTEVLSFSHPSCAWRPGSCVLAHQ